jgi:hypothetical protein
VHGSTRYQIKCRRVTHDNPSRQLGEFASFDPQRFDVLAAVIFLTDYSVDRAALVPFDVVRRLSTIVQTRQRFHMRDSVWEEPGVVDVTPELRRVEETQGGAA